MDYINIPFDYHSYLEEKRFWDCGGVVAEGRWSNVMSRVREEGVDLEIVEDYWVCEDSSIGFLVTFLFSI